MKIELDLPEIEGYEYTGEYRKPKEDEYYKAVRDARQAESDSSSEYPILKKKAPKYRTYSFGSCMECSTGESYEFVEIKALEDAIELSNTNIEDMTDTQCRAWEVLRSLIN